MATEHTSYKKKVVEMLTEERNSLTQRIQQTDDIKARLVGELEEVTALMELIVDEGVKVVITEEKQTTIVPKPQNNGSQTSDVEAKKELILNTLDPVLPKTARQISRTLDLPHGTIARYISMLSRDNRVKRLGKRAGGSKGYIRIS